MSEDHKQAELDIDKEIASLDDFLNEEHDSEDIHAFPLDDDLDDAFSPPKKSSKGKLLGSVALLAILCGGIYGGIQYLPQIMMNPELTEFERNLQNRSDNFVQNIVPEPVKENDTPPSLPNELIDITPEKQQFPVPADTVGVNDFETVSVDEINAVPVMNDSFGEDVIDNNIVADDDVQAATNIADIVNIAEQAAMEQEQKQEPEILPINDDQAVENLKDLPSNEEMIDQIATDIEIDTETAFSEDDQNDILSDADGRISASLPTSFERIQAKSLKKSIEEKEKQLAVEKEAMESFSADVGVDNSIMSEDDNLSADVLPAVETVSQKEDVLNENLDAMDAQNVVETPEKVEASPVIPETEPTQSLTEEKEAVTVAKAVVHNEVPRSPVLEAVNETDEEAKVVSSEPQKTVVKAPKVEEAASSVPVSQPAPTSVKKENVEAKPATKKQPKAISKPLDPRIEKARFAYRQGDYQTALSLYDAVLADDKGSTPALMGRQLIASKMRLVTDVQPVPVAPQPVHQETIIPTSQVDTGVFAEKTSQITPERDANVALKKAQEYHASGDRMKAIEWYRKALQLDVIYKANIDRRGVYDALAELQ